MGFLLGQAGGWLTFAFLCVVFSLRLATLRCRAVENMSKMEKEQATTGQESTP